jgi:hypothetical protein
VSQPVYAVYKNEDKEGDYQGLGQACAAWVIDPAGEKVVKLDHEGKILEGITPEESLNDLESWEGSICLTPIIN